MNNFPKNSYQETNGKNRMIGLSPTPISAIFQNRITDTNTFLAENQQNVNQYLFSANKTLSKGIVNNNQITYPNNPSEYGLYLDRKEFKLEMPLYPNISENVASENVNEYVCIIDSSDRNLNQYPSPFKLKAFFSQNDDSVYLNIPRVFENVKFMRIENVILPRNYFLNKHSVSNVSSDTIIPTEDKTAVISAINEILSYTNSSNDIPTTLVSNSEIKTVKVINLKSYTYSVTITDGNKTGIYEVIYPSNSTFNNEYYSKTKTSGQTIINTDVDQYLENQSYNYVTVIGQSKKAVVGDYELTFTLNSIDLVKYSVKFMIDNNIATRRCYEYNVNNPGSSGLLDFYFFSSKNLDGDRYIMLSIDEINDNNINSTNSSLRKAFCLLYPDSYGELHYYASSNYQDKIYKMSNLGNINRLTLTLNDSYGKPLTMPNLDFHVNNSKACYCDDNDDDWECPCTYIRHPFYKWLQVQYMIKIGVVETEIDKKIFY